MAKSFRLKYTHRERKHPLATTNTRSFDAGLTKPPSTTYVTNYHSAGVVAQW
jgi:hypothetical protein